MSASVFSFTRALARVCALRHKRRAPLPRVDQTQHTTPEPRRRTIMRAAARRDGATWESDVVAPAVHDRGYALDRAIYNARRRRGLRGRA